MASRRLRNQSQKERDEVDVLLGGGLFETLLLRVAVAAIILTGVYGVLDILYRVLP